MVCERVGVFSASYVLLHAGAGCGRQQPQSATLAGVPAARRQQLSAASTQHAATRSEVRRPPCTPLWHSHLMLSSINS